MVDLFANSLAEAAENVLWVGTGVPPVVDSVESSGNSNGLGDSGNVGSVYFLAVDTRGVLRDSVAREGGRLIVAWKGTVSCPRETR